MNQLAVTGKQKRNPLTEPTVVDLAAGYGPGSQPEEIRSQVQYFDVYCETSREKTRGHLPAAKEFVSSAGYLEYIAELDAAAEFANKRVIAVVLAKLVAAFPNAAKADLSTFGAILAEDIEAAMPSVHAVVTACRTLRRTSRFVPTIAEVLEEIGKEEARLKRVRAWMYELPDMVAKTEQRLLAHDAEGRKWAARKQFESAIQANDPSLWRMIARQTFEEKLATVQSEYGLDLKGLSVEGALPIVTEAAKKHGAEVSNA